MDQDQRGLGTEEAEGLDQQIERHGERDRGHQPAHHDRHEGERPAARMRANA